jgi:hypothetical protein
VRLRTRTPDLIAGAFADAVASGDLEAAEGWLAVAAYAERRSPDARRADRRLSWRDLRTRRRDPAAA